MTIETRIVKLEKRAIAKRPQMLPPTLKQIAALRARLAVMVAASSPVTRQQIFENVRDIRAHLHEKMRKTHALPY